MTEPVIASTPHVNHHCIIQQNKNMMKKLIIDAKFAFHRNKYKAKYQQVSNLMEKMANLNLKMIRLNVQIFKKNERER